MSDDGEIVVVLEREEALRLAESLKSAYYVKHASSLPINEIMQDHNKGYSLRRLADKYGMSYETIRRSLQSV